MLLSDKKEYIQNTSNMIINFIPNFENEYNLIFAIVNSKGEQSFIMRTIDEKLAGEIDEKVINDFIKNKLINNIGAEQLLKIKDND